MVLFLKRSRNLFFRLQLFCKVREQSRAFFLFFNWIFLKLRKQKKKVPHLQWVFTIPKRLRPYFRYDRGLLGKLCRAAYETVVAVYRLELDGDSGVPAMVGAVQTFGDLVHWHPHIHAIVAEGVFTEGGRFVHIPDIWRHRAADSEFDF